MIILARTCHQCGMQMPKEHDSLRVNQGTYIITGIARRCRCGHLQPNEFEDEA